jgi:HNH endonuclease/AP2 domain
MPSFERNDDMRKNNSTLTAERARELLDYNPDTGVLVWRGGHKKAKAGQTAGGFDKTTGYMKVGVDGRRYPFTHIVWLIVTGAFPTKEVDHKDRCRTNNRWSNLREASDSQQSQNRDVSAANRTGHKGVCFDTKRGKWLAQLKIDGRKVLFKRFDNIGDAVAAYAAAAEQHHAYNPIAHK